MSPVTAPATDPPAGTRHFSTRQGRQIGAGGTVARVAFGVALMAWAVADGIGPQTLIVAGALAAGVVMAQLALSRLPASRRRVTNPITRCVAECLPVVAPIVLLQFELTRSGILVFYGASALLAAARGLGGCEVTALPNLILGRDDRIGCLLFSPIDTLEARRGGGRGQLHPFRESSVTFRHSGPTDV